MEINDHIIWLPSRVIPLWGHLGVPMYVLMTFVALGLGTAWWLTSSWRLTDAMWKRSVALIIIAVLSVFFTRLFHIVFWGFEQTMAHPRLLWQVTVGRSIHGLYAGMALSAVVVARLWDVPISTVADRLSLWPLLGLICARIGNFWNSAMVGIPTDLPFGVGFYFYGDHGAIPRHPVQLYEGGLTAILLLVMVIMFVRKRLSPYGSVALSLAGYSLIRFCCDFLKEDPGFFFGHLLSTGQVLSILYFTVGVWAYFNFGFKKRLTLSKP